jgi:Ca-activated chloride channel homolog
MIFKPLFHPLILLLLLAIMIGLTFVLLWRADKSKRKVWLTRLVMVLLLFIMALRPSLTGGQSKIGISNFDIVYAIDTTSSMVAEDYDGNKPRLDGVRSDIQKLTKDFAGARFSVVSFDSNTTQILPFTTDTTATVTAANTVSQEITYYSTGSSIDMPIDELKKIFSKSKDSKPDRVRLLFYFGDGEQTIDRQPNSFSTLKPLINGGAVLGYGTDKGGKMKEFSGYDTDEETRYIIDYSINDFKNRDALSKIDQDNLRKISTDIGGIYENRNTPADTVNIVKGISVPKLERTSVDVSATTDLYWLFALPFAALLLLDIRRLLDMLNEIKAGSRHE